MHTFLFHLDRRCRWLLVALVGVLIATGTASADNGKIEFNRDIRPILSDKCFYCHGPDKNHRKGKLRLDQREDALDKKAIVPGKPSESELITRIFSTDADELMPPAEAHKTLTPVQKELLKKWIEQGAEYQAHWAYITPSRPAPPIVSDVRWSHNSIDQFILSRLENAKLQPSEEADRRTLLRRLSLDLTGLPPTPAETDAFLRDKSPQAYEKQVDRLMASPHYGERMAVPWLDAVRYTDTVGYHGDQNQNIFPYRDYVIAAFNNNKPFDQFTIEQLAGDLLPNPTTEQIIATGFNRLNMMTREGGAQPKEYLAKYAADRVRTVGTAWLGSTLGCSECHDHKFDPFTAKDFYSMAAYFADIKQWGVYSYYNYTPTPELKGFNNEFPFPPEKEVESTYLKTRAEYLRLRLDDIAKDTYRDLGKSKIGKQQFTNWKQESLQWFATNKSGWIRPAVQVLTANGAKGAEKNKKKAEKLPDMVTATNAVVKDDQVIVFTGKQTSGEKFELALPPGKFTSLRLELIQTAENRRSILRDNAAGTTIRFKVAIKHVNSAKPEPVTLEHGMADHWEDRYASGSIITGVKDGWKVAEDLLKTPQTAAWQFTKPIVAEAGDTLVITMEDNTIGGLRWSVSPFADFDPLQPDLAEKLPAALNTKSAENKWLQKVFLLSSQTETNALKEFRELRDQLLACRDGKTFTLITVAWEPAVTRVLARGNWQDETGAIVTPAPPQFLVRSKGDDAPRQTRLDLARWIVSPQNPLTSRVMVNRLWKQFFGNGLCNSVEDMGAQGEWPSHPELLDWLAVEFRESGWDYKHMVRLMVTSSAYRQSSNLKPAVIESDPENRLLASQNPRRLEAEFVRDNALFAAGMLNLDLGGPSSYPYQPEGYYESLQFPDRNYISEKDDRQYRRGVYTHWQRTFLHPMLANFDAPSREECTGLRNVSNTPQQALTLLNDPSFVEAARVLAQNVLEASKNDTKRLELVYQRCLSRLPKEAEKKSLQILLKAQKTYYQENTAEAEKLLKVGNTTSNPTLTPAEHAAWTAVCRVILNLHETITRY